MNYSKTLKNKKILLTCGPTWIALDPVRVISNISTGELGHRISHRLCREKAKVTLLQGPGTHPLRHIPFQVIPFQFFNELSKSLKDELKQKKYDIVIHTAAVSDYQGCLSTTKKIKSRQESICLKLAPTPKLIQMIKLLRPEIFLVGFKLETEDKKEFLINQAAHLIAKAKCNLVVVNLSRGSHYKGYIIDSSKKILAVELSREKIAQRLTDILRNRA